MFNCDTKCVSCFIKLSNDETGIGICRNCLIKRIERLMPIAQKKHGITRDAILQNSLGFFGYIKLKFKNFFNNL